MAMKRGEITLLVLADFSKAFDTIKYKTVLTKLSKLGFSKSFLRWTLSYLTNRKQFVQIDDRRSEILTLNFGIPQGSILGPLIFNLYVADLHEHLDAECRQYADDTSIYSCIKPADLPRSIMSMQATLEKLEKWSDHSNLVMNPEKTKTMLISTVQMSKAHSSTNADLNLKINGTTLERVNSAKLLGTILHEHLKWEENVKSVAKSCYGTLATLRKLKNVLPFHIKKSVVLSLVLSKLYFNDIAYNNLPEYLIKRLQRVQKAAASFVLGHYCTTTDLQKLRWLPFKEQLHYNNLKAIHEALYQSNWPEDLKLKILKQERTLRSNSGLLLEKPKMTNTFQDEASKYFNSLPEHIRNCAESKIFLRDSFNYLFNKAYDSSI